MGLFIPQTYVDGKLMLILLDDKFDIEQFKFNYGIFYQVAPALFEFWIKPEDTGRMMELWIYCTLKEHFEGTKFEVFNHVSIYESAVQAENIQQLLETPSRKKEESEMEQQKEEIVDVDCLIMEGDKVACFIECKSGKPKWADTLKFHGMVSLFGAPFGILIGGDSWLKNTNPEYTNIKIFTNVIERFEFPNELFEYLDSKLGIYPSV